MPSPPAGGDGVNPSIRIAVDIGGTFTDGVAEDSRGNVTTAVHCPPPEIRILADAARGSVTVEPDAAPG